MYFCNMFLRLNNFLNNSDKEFSSDIAQQNYDGCRSVISSPYLIFIKHLRPPSLYQNDTNKNFARIFKFFRNRREILKSFRMWSIRKCIAQLRCYDFKSSSEWCLLRIYYWFDQRDTLGDRYFLLNLPAFYILCQ